MVSGVAGVDRFRIMTLSTWSESDRFSILIVSYSRLRTAIYAN